MAGENTILTLRLEDFKDSIIRRCSYRGICICLWPQTVFARFRRVITSRRQRPNRLNSRIQRGRFAPVVHLAPAWVLSGSETATLRGHAHRPRPAIMPRARCPLANTHNPACLTSIPRYTCTNFQKKKIKKTNFFRRPYIKRRRFYVPVSKLENRYKTKNTACTTTCEVIVETHAVRKRKKNYGRKKMIRRRDARSNHTR